MNTIGVHYQTWKNYESVKFVISKFREIYPDAPIRMVSDAGEDFSDIAETYNCIFDYESQNIFPRGILLGHPQSLSGNTSQVGAYTWLKRLYDTSVQFNTDWILIMEDDVLTRHAVTRFPTTDAAGATQHEFYPGLRNLLMERNTKNSMWGYGLCGGSLINRQFFVTAYETQLKEFDLEYLSKLDSRIYGWSDVLLTAFIIFSGGTYSISEELEDITSNNIPNPPAAFEHPVKKYYSEKNQGSLNNK